MIVEILIILIVLIVFLELTKSWRFKLSSQIHKKWNDLIHNKEDDGKAKLIENECVLCLAGKNEFNPLVVGAKGAVCQNCILDSFYLLDSELIKSQKIPKSTYRLICKLLGSDEHILTENIREPMEMMMLSVYHHDIDFYRELILEITQYGPKPFIKKLLNRIPKENWTWSDAINWSWVCGKKGDFREALDLPEISGDAKYPYHPDILEINKISSQIEVENNSEIIEKLYITLFKFNEKYKALKQPVEDQVPVSFLTNILDIMAKCRYLLDDLDGARQYLDESAEIGNLSPYGELLYGDICRDQGRLEDAHNHWQKGLDCKERGYVRNELTSRLQR